MIAIRRFKKNAQICCKPTLKSRHKTLNFAEYVCMTILLDCGVGNMHVSSGAHALRRGDLGLEPFVLADHVIDVANFGGLPWF